MRGSDGYVVDPGILPIDPTGILTLPIDLTGSRDWGLGVNIGSPQMRPTESNHMPDLPLMPTATRPAGQSC